MRMRTVTHALLLMSACLASTGVAEANGRYPAAQHVLVGPAAAGNPIVLRNTFGFLASSDGGQSFGWICEAALGYGGEYDPAFALDASGRTHFGLYDGLVRTAPDACGVERLALFEGENVVDLDNHPSGQSIFALAVTPFVSGGPTPTARVYRSDDAGGTYALVGSIPGALLETLEHAPSDPTRVYLSGATAPPTRPIVYRSDDGGASSVELAHTWPDDVERLFVAGIDPSDADTMFLRATLKPSSGQSTAIFRTRDGGASFEELLRTTSPALGFAVSSDGDEVWVGSPAEGLLRSSDGGDTFTLVRRDAVRCLRHHEGALYVCGGPPQTTPMLGRSDDGGLTVEPLVASCALEGTTACSAPGSAVAQCAGAWPQVGSILPCIETGDGGGGSGGASASTGGGDGGDASGSGGRAGGAPALDASASADGCAIRRSSDDEPASAWWWLAILGLARRRRARSR
jgi:hypothetical protein